MSSPILYGKQEVISTTRIKKSRYYEYLENGILPPPVGREGNANRWSSAVINDVSNRMLILGDDYTSEHTLGIMLEHLAKHEAMINAFKAKL